MTPTSLRAALTLENGNAILGCTVAGTTTTFWTVAHTPVSGGLYQLVLGNPNTANQYVFSVYCNGTQIGTTYTDSGHVSQLGSSYLYAALGMQAAVGIPASLSSWGVSDNAPAATIGSVFRQYRASTSTVTIASGNNLLANSFFDTNQYLTSDLTYAAGTQNKLTISVAGTYMVKMSFYIDAGGAGSNALGPILYHNGSVAQFGNQVVTSSGYTGPWGDSFLIYCAAGDTLQPGTSSNISTFNLFGESTGAYCYWEVALCNCGTLS